MEETLETTEPISTIGKDNSASNLTDMSLSNTTTDFPITENEEIEYVNVWVHSPTEATIDQEINQHRVEEELVYYYYL